jgi:hypothetical protein
MFEVRRDADIHSADGGWYSARWHFSFAGYRDPARVGLGPLRVFNDDRLSPGAVWPMHPHRDIEGVTYVVEGVFEHADSLGNGGVLEAGAVQRATLGSGMEHSERNGSSSQPMRFLQFWILPDTADLPPSVEQRQFTVADRTDRLLKVLGPEGGEVVKVHQDAGAYVARLAIGARVSHRVQPHRGAYLYVIDGAARVNDEKASTGDVVISTDEGSLDVTAVGTTELILIDVTLDWQPAGIWA